jgi:hypothetical protein
MEDKDVFIFNEPLSEDELESFKNILKYLAVEHGIHLENFERLFACLREEEK